MVGIGVARVAAKTARCSTAMLRVRIVFPTSVFQGMALRGAGADVRITDAAMLFHGVLRIVVLIILRACAVATVLIFSPATAVVTSAIASMLAGRVIFPITIGIRAVGRAPVNNLAAVPANFLPVAAIPRCIGIVVLAGRIFFVAALCADTSGIETMGLCVAIRILVCTAICTALPDVMLGFILLLVVIGKAARRAVTARNAASAIVTSSQVTISSADISTPENAVSEM